MPRLLCGVLPAPAAATRGAGRAHAPEQPGVPRPPPPLCLGPQGSAPARGCCAARGGGGVGVVLRGPGRGALPQPGRREPHRSPPHHRENFLPGGCRRGAAEARTAAPAERRRACPVTGMTSAPAAAAPAPPPLAGPGPRPPGGGPRPLARGGGAEPAPLEGSGPRGVRRRPSLAPPQREQWARGPAAAEGGLLRAAGPRGGRLGPGREAPRRREGDAADSPR